METVFRLWKRIGVIFRTSETSPKKFRRSEVLFFRVPSVGNAATGIFCVRFFTSVTYEKTQNIETYEKRSADTPVRQNMLPTVLIQFAFSRFTS